MADEWIKLPRSERITIGKLICDVWPVGGGARYTVTGADGRYIKGGQCADLTWARQVSMQFAESLQALKVYQ